MLPYGYSLTYKHHNYLVKTQGAAETICFLNVYLDSHVTVTLSLLKWSFHLSVSM